MYVKPPSVCSIMYHVTGCKWKCVHIDDPRSPEIRLPSLRQCMLLTPSQIIAKLLPQPEPESEPEPMQGLPNDDDDVTEDQEMLADDDDDMKDIAAATDDAMEMAEAEAEPTRATDDDDEEEKMEEDDDDDMPPLEGEEGTAETIAVSVLSFDHVNLQTKNQYGAVFIMKKYSFYFADSVSGKCLFFF